MYRESSQFITHAFVYRNTYPHFPSNKRFTRRVFKIYLSQSFSIGAELVIMNLYSAGLNLIAVCYLVVVISSGGCTTIQVPSGPNSTLQSYLCGGSRLSNGTSLLLEAGEHVISGGPFCSISHLQDLAITGAGRDLTVVRCNASGRGFKFSSVENLTIAKMAFSGCGQNTMVYMPNLNLSTTSPVVLYFNSSSFIMQHITITGFSGFGVYGFELQPVILSDVQILNCVSNCSGAVFVNTKPFDFNASNWTVTLQECLFENITQSKENPNYYIGSGLSVWSLAAYILDCVFNNHFSMNGAFLVSHSLAIITNNTFISLDGGALRLNYSFLNFINCKFYRNLAADHGAAIYASNNYYMFVSGCLFEENVAPVWGGAISSFESCRVDNEHEMLSDNLTVIITDCEFTNNAATVGGAIFIFNSCQYSHVKISETILQNNSAHTGAAIYAGDYHQADGSETYILELNDLLVLENRCSSSVAEQDVGAAVCYSEVSNVVISGGMFVRNSPQGAIQGFSGNLYITGDVLFKNNTGENGGAIYLMNNGHVYFNESCNVVFDGNTASTYGGAIYIQGDPNIPKNRNFLWIQCAIHFIGQQVNHTITFRGNNAFVAGQSIYASPIYNCSLMLPPLMDNRSFYSQHPSLFYNQVFNFPSNISALQILSLPLHILLCSCNDAAQCDMMTSGVYNIASSPGRMVQITATSLDSDNNTSPAVVYTNVATNSRNVSLAPQQNVQWIGKSCDTIKYQIYGQENSTINLQLSTFKGIPIILHITLEPCDPGFVLMTNSEGLLMCNCSSFLISYVLNCDVASGTVTRRDNQWIGVYNDGTRNIPALSYTCPLDYCKSSCSTVALVTSNALCAKTRHGLLCGHCHTNLSVLFGSTECQVCSDLWLLTILLHAALGIVLVAVLFVLNITVTQGTIYGLIFYANVVQMNSSVFFNQPSLKPLRVLISFINLDLGFPLCFYNGMDDAAKTGLQFVFPVYLLVLTVFVVMVCRFWLSQSTGPNVSKNDYLNRFSRYVGKRAVSVLATLIYLSYSKLLRTVIDILTYATVMVEDDTQLRVWFYDGTVRYLEGRHLPLFCIAIATSVFFILPYSLALTLIPIIARYSDHNRLFNWLHQKANLLKPMNDAYFASYKGVWRSWLGVRLWLLVILYIPTPVYSSDRPYLLMFIHGGILVVFLFIQAYVKPFEEPRMVSNKIFTDIFNWIDSFYFLNYAILALTLSYLLSNGSKTDYIDITVGCLVGLSGIMISATLIYHVYMAVRDICCSRDTTLGRVAQSSSVRQAMDESSESRLLPVPQLTFHDDFREPLMES